jgi:hypothetical protein
VSLFGEPVQDARLGLYVVEHCPVRDQMVAPQAGGCVTDSAPRLASAYPRPMSRRSHLPLEGIGRERQVQHELLEIPARPQRVEDRILADLAEVLIAGCDSAAQRLDRLLGV